MAQLGAKVRVIGDWDGSAIKKAEKELDSFGNSIKKGWTGIGAAVAGAFAFTEAIDFLKNATQAAIEDEKSMVSLAKAMENLGLAGQNAQVEGFVEKLMLATGTADDALRPALQRLLIVTNDVATSQKALSLALDVSAGTGRDLDSVTMALAKAYGGQTTALQRLGVGLDQSVLKSRDMDAITAELSAKFSGQAAAAAETYGGRIQRLNVAVGEAQETIGYALLNALDRVTSRLGGTGGFTVVITQAADNTADFTIGVGALVDQLLRLGRVTNTASEENKGLIERFQELLLKNPQFGFLRIAGVITDLGAATRASEAATDLAAKRNKEYADGIPHFLRNVNAATNALGDLADETIRVKNAQDFADFTVIAGNKYYQDAAVRARGLAEANKEVETTTRGAGAATASAVKSFSDMRKELLASIEDSPAEKYGNLITQLKDNLRDAEQTFISFKDSVVSSITQAFSFGDAYAAAKESGMTFLQALTDQANNAVMFADRIKQLVILGLSPEALQQVLAAGVTAGTGIANQLIEGGATTIQETNRLVETSTAAAEEVAQLAASAYFGAGAKSAQDTLDGFAAQLGPDGPSNKRMQRIMDNLAASLNRSATVTITTVHRNVFESVKLPGRAVGGPVSANTAYVVGERGPEVFVPDVSGAIIPNGPATAGGVGGLGSTINLVVNAGMGTNGAEVGRQIVDALKQYERRNGPVPITVA